MSIFSEQDTQWNDIDYMSNHEDWTLNPHKFDNLSSLVDNLHSNGQHYMFILVGIVLYLFITKLFLDYKVWQWMRDNNDEHL